MSDQELAINGGPKVREQPWPERLQIDDREVDAVMRVMEAAKKGNPFERYGGVEVDTFEQEFAAAIGTKFATAVSSGTASIHTALGALRLDAGSEVICAPITDPGAIMPVLWNNCVPIFADSYEDNFNMDPASIPALITDQTRAIVCGHITGCPCDMGAILEIARKHDLYVIEDCAQAHYGRYRDKLLGSVGHIGCFSLMSGKHTTAGGQGGMVVTDDEELYWNAKRFADRGKPFNSDAPGNLFLGMNYRVTELSAAIGRVQLEKMPAITQARRDYVAAFEAALAKEEVVCCEPVPLHAEGESAYWFGTLLFHADRCTKTMAEYGEAVAAEGVPVGGSYAGALVPVAQWINDMQTYGQSREPWTSPHWKGDISKLNYAESVPQALKCVEQVMRYSVHECQSPADAEDMAKAIGKVDRACRK